MENWEKYIVSNPEIRNGKPCIIGTRITVGDILTYLSNDNSIEEIIEDYPKLDRNKILAVQEYSNQKQ